MIRATPQILRLMLSSVDDGKLRWRPADGGWCIKEAIGHLIEADRFAFAERIKLILTEEVPTLTGRDPEAAAAEPSHIDKPLKALLDELEYQREEYATWVATITPEQMARQATYPPYGAFTAADFVYEWGYHDHEHLKQISTILRQQIWPYLGEAMQGGVERP